MTRQAAIDLARRVKYNYVQAVKLGGDPCFCWVVARSGVTPAHEAAVRCGDCEAAMAKLVGAPSLVLAAVIDFIAALRGGAFDD